MWFAVFRRLFFRRVDPFATSRPGLLERIGGRVFPRHCLVCGRDTRAWEPYCTAHRGEPERPGDISP
jgi:hypothetical protein